MKKYLLFSMALCLGAAAMTSCSQDDEIAPVVQEEVQTKAALGVDFQLDGMSTRAAQVGPISAWTSGDQIGMFLTAGQLGNPYLGKAEYDNVMWSYSTSNGWQCGQDGKGEMLLGNDEGTLYAYYPYAADIDPTAMAVNLDQTDYLYGTGDNTVSFAKLNTKVVMKHAMTQFVIYLKRGTYKKDGNITSVSLKNMNSKQNIVDGGKLNIATGVISGGAAASLAINTAAETLPTSNTEEVSFMKIMVPFAATEAAGDVRLQLTIDGVDFYYDLPKTTAFQAGHRNIYRATVNSNSLSIGKDDITIEPWVDETEKEAELSPLTD